jgi:hypothetical protein
VASRSTSTRSWPSRCPRAARTAGPPSTRSASPRSITPSCRPGALTSPVSTSPSAGAATAAGGCKAGIRARPPTRWAQDNRKLAAHLVRERDALFTFLYHPEVPATNWAAEQAIRPAVATRKVCGGNRTWHGAHTQEILITVLRTSAQQDRDPYALLAALLCAPAPRVAVELLPSARSP